MGRMKELDNNFKRDDKVDFRHDNFNDMAAAIEYTDDMMIDLRDDLIGVDNAVIKAYSKLTKIPINIQHIPEDKYVDHIKTLIEIKSRIRIAIDYLLDVESDIDSYFNTSDYESRLRDDITASIDKDLINYLDTYVPEVNVQHNKDELSTSFPDVTLMKSGCQHSYKFLK